MLTAPLLPCRRVRQLPVTQVDNRIIVQTLEDLVDLALCEICGPVGLISPSHPNSEIWEQVSDEELDTNWPEGEWNFRQSSSEHPEVAKFETSEP